MMTGSSGLCETKRFARVKSEGCTCQAAVALSKNGFSILFSILRAIFGANNCQSQQMVEAHKTIANIGGISGCQKE
jgi:hypothetical protein